jgi:Sap, sulfolipid-1-addressing protein
MGTIVLLACLSAFNPTLIAVITVMLLLPNPGRLMLGYWLGAMITSITLGLLIVFSLHSSSAVSTTKKTLSPLADVVLGALALVLAVMLAQARDKRLTARRAKRKHDKKPPRWQNALRDGNAKTTFVIGAALTCPAPHTSPA